MNGQITEKRIKDKVKQFLAQHRLMALYFGRWHQGKGFLAARICIMHYSGGPTFWWGIHVYNNGTVRRVN